MARFGNRVKESTETIGTGTLDLSGAPTGFRGFGDEFTTGDDEISYLIVDDPDNPTDYEYGKGTFTAGTPDTLARNTVEGSSNAGNLVSFTAGTKTVIATPLAADFNLIAGLDEAFVDVASATTTDIGAATSRNVRITGTTTITGLGTVAAGTTRRIRFAGALTLTHNGTSLILPGAANITTAANDTAVAVSLGLGNWLVTNYEAADGLPVAGQTVVQQVIDQDSAVATGITLIPADDTIPQNTEGDEYLSVTITPTNANNILVIDVIVFGSHSVASNNTAALFQDATADALRCGVDRGDVGAALTTTVFRHRMTAGTTSATTFKVRAGGNASGTFTFNGQSGGRSFGGVAGSSLTVTELAA